LVINSANLFWLVSLLIVNKLLYSLEIYNKIHSNYKENLNEINILPEKEVNKKVANKLIGNTILFDSSDFHSVSSITSGIRYSLVFWLKLEHIENDKPLI
jgi:hypothetical protein